MKKGGVLLEKKKVMNEGVNRKREGEGGRKWELKKKGGRVGERLLSIVGFFCHCGRSK